MTITTVTGPAAAVFTKDDAVLRQQLRLEDDETDEDTLITEAVAAATAQIEAYLRRRLITQTVRITRDGFGPGGICLPVAPIQSVDQVTYIDGAGVEQTMASSDYRLIQSAQPAELHPAYGETWPVPRTADKATVKIDLVVGYGAAGSAVPADIRAALRLLVGHNFRFREAGMPGVTVAEIPLGVRTMLDPHRFWV